MDWENAIFGPGWVWSMLSIILVVGSLFGLYRQLRLQHTQTAIDQMAAFTEEAYSEQMQRYGLDAMIALRDHDDPADIPEGAVLGLGDFWDNFATLARSGHRDPSLLWQSNSASPQIVWWWIAPFVRKARTDDTLGVPSYVDFEWLVGVLAEMDRAGGRQVITRERVMADLDRLIRLQRDLIRTMHASRSERLVLGD